MAKQTEKRPDLRTKAGREWKKKNGDAPPPLAQDHETERLIRAIHRSEVTMRAMASQIRPGMADNVAARIRTDLLDEADRFNRLHSTVIERLKK